MISSNSVERTAFRLSPSPVLRPDVCTIRRFEIAARFCEPLAMTLTRFDFIFAEVGPGIVFEV